MSWVKLDDGFTDHRKIEPLTDRAFRLHVAGLCFCARTLSDGFIPESRVRRLLPTVTKGMVTELVTVEAWEHVDGGINVVGYLEYNPSAEQVKSDRDYAKLRKELYGNPEVVQEIRKRDGNKCRYCGCMVNWRDRRSSTGATYDHLIPRGPNTIENIVVACRGCNSKKGARTPEEAGMALLEPGTGTSSRPRTESDTRPTPSRPEGSRDGVSEEPSAVAVAPAAEGGATTPETKLDGEQVALNVSRARSARAALRGS